MAIAYTGTSETFVATLDSPSAVEALFGDPIILYSERFGSLALACVKANRLNPGSSVLLDDSVEPPVLELGEAIAVVHPVTYDDETGGAVVDYNDRSLGQRVVGGLYGGPGSELSIL